MAYCRTTTPGSDVYVIGLAHGVECVASGCLFGGFRGTPGEMIQHLLDHRDRGDAVPQDVIDELGAEQRALDEGTGA